MRITPLALDRRSTGAAVDAEGQLQATLGGGRCAITMQRDNNGTDYVLGSDPAEQERLVVQHRLWRPRAEAAWRRAKPVPQSQSRLAWRQEWHAGLKA